MIILLCIASFSKPGIEDFTFINKIGGKNLSIFIEEIPQKYNIDLFPGITDPCDLNNNESDMLEPLVHCILKNSPFVSDSKKDSTFIFVPMYTNALRRQNKLINLSSIVKDDAFKRWKGSRHIVVDSLMTNQHISGFTNFKDQHLLISTNISIEFIRENRWMNSRHILVPPIQKFNLYPLKPNREGVIFIGKSEQMKEAAKSLSYKVLENINNTYEFLEEISSAKYIVFEPSEDIPPFLIYDILRMQIIPIMVTRSFLGAYANTHINYSRISMRIEPGKLMETLEKRIKEFDYEESAKYLENVVKYLFWPLNGIPSMDDASGVLIDYLNTRHRVLRPVLRRTFIGSDEYIP